MKKVNLFDIHFIKKTCKNHNNMRPRNLEPNKYTTRLNRATVQHFSGAKMTGLLLKLLEPFNLALAI